MAIKDQLAKLDGLYSLTDREWVLEIHHCLTEPTCPTVVIRPEDLQIARYRVDTSSIEDGISRAVELVYREVVLGQEVGHGAPFTNADDKVWAEELALIRKRHA